MKKIHRVMVFAMIGIVFGAGFFPLIAGISAYNIQNIAMLDDDEMDQHNIRSDGYSWACSSGAYLAQSFKPTLEILTRIEVRLFVNGSPSGLTISIRENLDGADLISKTLMAHEMTIVDYWVEYDVSDIILVPENTYYIVWNPEGISNCTDFYAWNLKDDNEYSRGNAWSNTNGSWNVLDPDTLPKGDPDFCFITYGIANQAPDTPSKPNGPIQGDVHEEYYYESTFSDPNGNILEIFFDWGDGSDSGWIEVSSDGTYGMAHQWAQDGPYNIRAKARDQYGVESGWSEALTVIVGNVAPEAPERPDGPSSGIAGTEYSYSTSAIDANGDKLYYFFDWGDGITSSWVGPFDSGESVTLSHTWSSQGDFSLQVKAKDTNDVESSWSESLIVTMPKQRTHHFMETLMERFFQRFGFFLDLQ